MEGENGTGEGVRTEAKRHSSESKKDEEMTLPPVDTIIQGDTLEVLKSWPDEFVDCIITSPPYYGLRDYKVKGQIGLEGTLDEYLEKMLAITAELKRVLKKTGSLWWNHGDSYGGSGMGWNSLVTDNQIASMPKVGHTRGLKLKSLLLQNFRLAQRMCDEQGWILRNVLIWHKPNVLPTSAIDRFAVDFEPVFFFVKSNRPQYWVNKKTRRSVKRQPEGTNGVEGADWEWRDCQICLRSKSGPNVAVMRKCGRKMCVDGRIRTSLWEARFYYFERQFETYKEALNRWGGEAFRAASASEWDKETGHNTHRARSYRPNPLGRNKRTVWSVPTGHFKGGHYATFPEKLIVPMIRAGCPEAICKKCGLAREAIYEPGEEYKKPLGRSWHDHSNDDDEEWATQKTGYTDCGCDHSDGWEKGVVLDPFMGSGTVAVVARKLGRHFLGIELKYEYVKLGERRVPESLF